METSPRRAVSPGVAIRQMGYLPFGLKIEEETFGQPFRRGQETRAKQAVNKLGGVLEHDATEVTDADYQLEFRQREFQRAVIVGSRRCGFGGFQAE